MHVSFQSFFINRLVSKFYLVDISICMNCNGIIMLSSVNVYFVVNDCNPFGLFEKWESIGYRGGSSIKICAFCGA